jgi:hypothetical protein
MGLDLPAPDHTTLSRRARAWRPAKRRNRQPVPDGPLHVLVHSAGLEVYGAGQWVEEKHGTKPRRRWRKLYLALDADSGEIIAHVITDKDAGDATQVEALLDQIDDPSANSRPMGLTMATRPMTPSPGIAPALRWSFRQGPMRWNHRTPISPAKETVISLRSMPMGG